MEMEVSRATGWTWGYTVLYWPAQSDSDLSEQLLRVRAVKWSGLLRFRTAGT